MTQKQFLLCIGDLLLLAMTIAVALLYSLIIGIIAFGLYASFTGPAKAHQAPSGWTYDAACCSNQDCNELPEGAVRETAEGYVVTAGPNENNQLLRVQTHVIPMSDFRIRQSKDEKFHACFSREFDGGNGIYTGGRLLCLYVPHRGY